MASSLSLSAEICIVKKEDAINGILLFMLLSQLVQARSA